jgi:hypothetical protein
VSIGKTVIEEVESGTIPWSVVRLALFNPGLKFLSKSRNKLFFDPFSKGQNSIGRLSGSSGSHSAPRDCSFEAVGEACHLQVNPNCRI